MLQDSVGNGSKISYLNIFNWSGKGSLTGFQAHLYCVLLSLNQSYVWKMSYCMWSDELVLASRWNSSALSKSLCANFILLQLRSCCQRQELRCYFFLFHHHSTIPIHIITSFCTAKTPTLTDAPSEYCLYSVASTWGPFYN